MAKSVIKITDGESALLQRLIQRIIDSFCSAQPVDPYIAVKRGDVRNRFGFREKQQHKKIPHQSAGLELEISEDYFFFSGLASALASALLLSLISILAFLRNCSI